MSKHLPKHWVQLSFTNTNTLVCKLQITNPKNTVKPPQVEYGKKIDAMHAIQKQRWQQTDVTRTLQGKSQHLILIYQV